MYDEPAQSRRTNLLVGAALLVLIVVGGVGGWLISGMLRGDNDVLASGNGPGGQATFEAWPTPKPTFTPRATLAVTESAPALPEIISTPDAVLSLTVTTASLPDDPAIAHFRVQTETVSIYDGPGSEYTALGAAPRGASLLIAGRSADGIWWLVCCAGEQSGWVPLDPGTLLLQGDVNTVTILDTPAGTAAEALASAPPTAPEAPPPPDAPQPPPPSPTAASQLPEEDSALPTPPPTPVQPTIPPPPPTPLPPLPTAVPAPARNLDGRLGALGVSIQPANVAPGQAYWRVVEVIWHDEEQSQGRHSIFVDALDQNGNRAIGQTLNISWADGSQQLLIENKPFPEYGANFPMFAAGQSYSLSVSGAPSETIHGMGLGDLDQRAWNIHVEYLVKFQLAMR